MKPHKHAEVIKAWADGAEIEVFVQGKWERREEPLWNTEIEYRVKPKPDVVMYTSAYDGEICPCDNEYENGDNLKLTFDGNTGKLKKAEVL